MSTLEKIAIIIVVMVPMIWLAVRVWRVRNRPIPPPSASSAIGMVPIPPDVSGPDVGAT